MKRVLEVGEIINAETDLTFMFLPKGCFWGSVDVEIDGEKVQEGKWPIVREIEDKQPDQSPEMIHVDIIRDVLNESIVSVTKNTADKLVCEKIIAMQKRMREVKDAESNKLR